MRPKFFIVSDVVNILSVALVQCPLKWESPLKNRAHFEEIINGIDPKIQLVVLPEMFTTGFSMNAAALAERQDGDTVGWLRQIALSTGKAITGSVIIREGKYFYNRLQFVFPDGHVHTYDKRHLFSFAGEDNVYTPGVARPVLEYLGWRICPLICYDLRFPVWSRNADLSGHSTDFVYDLLIYVANWPEARVSAWDSLLIARAHENQGYVIGVNRTGEDGNGIRYNGHSAVFGPRGEVMVKPSETDSVFYAELSRSVLEEYRQKFQVWRDKDHFKMM